MESNINGLKQLWAIMVPPTQTLSDVGPTILAAILALFFGLHPLIMVFVNANKARYGYVMRMSGEPEPSMWLTYIGKLVYTATAITVPLFVLVYVVGYLFIFVERMRGGVYQGNMMRSGFYVHTISGSIYLLAGVAQFYAPLRQHYPKIHRAIGYLYYLMVVITSLGLIALAHKPHAGISAQIAIVISLPQWVWLNIASFRAIVVNRDVESHRYLNTMGLVFASSIMLMRPVTMALMAYQSSWSFERGLGLALWICFVVSVNSAALYIYLGLIRPAARRPRLQHSGAVVVTGTGERGGMMPARIVSFTILDTARRTVLLSIDIGDPNDVQFPPGSHIALRLGEITREFCPISNSLYGGGGRNGPMELLVRLVPGGMFCMRLKAALKQITSSADVAVAMGCNIACEVYGPLYPAPERFGYLPYYPSRRSHSHSQPPSPSHSPLYSPPESADVEATLVMIAGGTGVTAFLPIIQAALRSDRDRRRLRLLCLTGSSKGRGGDKPTTLLPPSPTGVAGGRATKGIRAFATVALAVSRFLSLSKKGATEDLIYYFFVEAEIDQLYSLAASPGSDGKPCESGRFDAKLSASRFETDMVAEWVPSGGARGGSAAAPATVVYWLCGPAGHTAAVKRLLLASPRLRVKPAQIFIMGVDDR